MGEVIPFKRPRKHNWDPTNTQWASFEAMFCEVLHDMLDGKIQPAGAFILVRDKDGGDWCYRCELPLDDLEELMVAYLARKRAPPDGPETT